MGAIVRLKTHVVTTSGPNDKPLCMSFLDSSQMCSKICGEISSLHKTVYLQDVLHMSAGGSAKNQPRELVGIPEFPAHPEKAPLTQFKYSKLSKATADKNISSLDNHSAWR